MELKAHEDAEHQAQHGNHHLGAARTKAPTSSIAVPSRTLQYQDFGDDDGTWSPWEGSEVDHILLLSGLEVGALCRMLVSGLHRIHRILGFIGF